MTKLKKATIAVISVYLTTFVLLGCVGMLISPGWVYPLDTFIIFGFSAILALTAGWGLSLLIVKIWEWVERE